MHWKRDDKLKELGLGSPTCSLLGNDLRAVTDSGERVLVHPCVFTCGLRCNTNSR